jgi:hypothetical protein
LFSGLEMGLTELTSRDAVLEAIKEFDALGCDAFLKKYGFGQARSDLYRDFWMLPDGIDDTVVLFVSDKYVPLFSALASGFKGNKVVFYSTGVPPQAAGCTLQKFSGSRSTNWPYDCANAFLDGTIRIPGTEFE